MRDEGTPKGEGLYLTIYSESSPNKDSIYCYEYLENTSVLSYKVG